MGQNRDISNQNGTKLLHIKVKWDKIGTYQIKIGQNWDISDQNWDISNQNCTKLGHIKVKLGQIKIKIWRKKLEKLKYIYLAV